MTGYFACVIIISVIKRRLYGGYGEAVNTADCGSVTRRFKSCYPPQFLILGCSQVGKAQDFDSCMRRFEPCHPSQYGPLAQSVEHLTFNQGVPRSSRGWITRKSAPVRKNGSFFVDTVVITYCVIDINLVK